ncbi:hypothetical protein M8998_09220 [Sphingobacterium sp. lm-10]|uniref:hypothetical protein n=1 Tax=Sphingobacterium sp. lm-10 TaxID=2944904 RepID=UPI00202215E6|nr:hypothetical protein [Sphingobacterium sp. lm-10]MCL7988114.1 hypothetical protein [Sphingobacterium sp. lm-10]
MKKIIFLTVLVGLAYGSQAQVLKKVQRRLENKAEKKIDEMLDSKKTKPAAGSTNTQLEGVLGGLNPGEPFLRGTQLIFSDDLANDAPGSMPRYWQTNSTGAVVSLNGVSGKWLQLAARASYQLDTLLQLPKKFTLEFDLLTRASEASDLRDIDFGFSKNNSTKSYIYGVGKEVSVYSSLKYYYETITTDAGNNSSTLPFPLSNYANATMHISISVDGEQMQLFIDSQKVLDAAVIDINAPKHFFLSTDKYRNGAQAFISNFRVSSF